MDEENFLVETSMRLKEIKKTEDDIIFIGTNDLKESCSFVEFTELANFFYNSGYGRHFIRQDLVIVFRDGSHLARQEYDGSEWWEYRRSVTEIPEVTNKLTSVLQE